MPSYHTQKGFSLMEMAIVFGLIGMIVGGVWVYASIAEQTAKVEQSIESITVTLENTRNVYAGQSIITGNVATVVPFLVTSGAMPMGLIIGPPATSCQGSSAQYASTAWGSGSDACGSFRICAWTAGIGTASNINNSCVAPSAGGSQYIGVEFSHLNYSSCVALATHVTPTSPATGLADVYINTASMSAAQAGVLPATVGNSQANCTNSSINIVDFVYSLRAPTS